MNRQIIKSIAGSAMLTAMLAVATFSLTGCERKEKIVEIDTPAGDVKVEKSTDTGAVDVEVTDE